MSLEYPTTSAITMAARRRSIGILPDRSLTANVGQIYVGCSTATAAFGTKRPCTGVPDHGRCWAESRRAEMDVVAPYPDMPETAIAPPGAVRTRRSAILDKTGRQFVMFRDWNSSREDNHQIPAIPLAKISRNILAGSFAYTVCSGSGRRLRSSNQATNECPILPPEIPEYPTWKLDRPLNSLGATITLNQRVVGSNPTAPTK